MSALHVVTGATGFVGAALVVELLRQTDDLIVCLVRPGSASAEERFEAAFAEAAQAYALEPEVVAAAAVRCRVIAGDVTEEGCGVRQRVDGRVSHFWHCAASLRYENRYQGEIRKTNLDGTHQALALATRLGAEAFNHVSTAYVAGKRTGTIYEEPLSEVESNNFYERSKLEAEQLVLAESDMWVRILRPGIVIGHSRTRAATRFFGFYALLRSLVQFKGMMERAQAGLLQRTPLRVRVEAESGVNLIPVDSVARQAVLIGLRGPARGIFHLTHPDAPRAEMIGRMLCREIGLADPILVRGKEGFSWLDQRFDERLDFVGSYLVGDMRFDRTQADAALGRERGEEAPLDEPTLLAYSRWYLAHLRRERMHLPAQR